MNLVHRWFPALILAFTMAARLAAFTPDGGALWPDGTITMHLQMGNSPALTDGSTYNTSLDEALKQWNRNLGRVQFTSVIGSSGPVARGNGYNNVVLHENIYGQAFGENVLAVTLWRTSGTARIEGDVIFNNAEKWDSYRGSLNYSKPDIRRVALHEFGHVLGLTHPDEAGQYVTAVMNSHVSNVDSLQVDDRQGAATLYGMGVDNPFPPPSITEQPRDLTVMEGQGPATFSVAALGTGDLRYQWRKDGSTITGATGTTYSIAAVQVSDAGSYTVVITGAGGSTTSNPARLTVTPSIAPSFPGEHPDIQVEIGAWGTFWGLLPNGTPPFTYQWYKDGIPLPGETGPYLSVAVRSDAQTGTYVLEARNTAGETRTNGARLTLFRQALPPIPSLNAGTGGAVLGRPLTLESFIGNFTTPVSVQWFKDGQPIVGATGWNYKLTSFADEDAGEYSLTLTNSAGAVSASNGVRIHVQSSLGSSTYPWWRAFRQANVYYFFHRNSPVRLERYDLTAGWLSGLVLTTDTWDVTVADGALYFADGLNLRRMALDGTTNTIIATLGEAVQRIWAWREFLILLQSGGSKYTVVRRDSGAVISTVYIDNNRIDYASAVLAPDSGRIVAATGASPLAIVSLELTIAGEVQYQGSAPLFATSTPPAQHITASSDETQFAALGGTIFSRNDLSPVGDLGKWATDVAHHPSGWIALRNNRLFRYDDRFRQIGHLDLTREGASLFIVDDEVLVFCLPPTSDDRPVVLRHPLTDFHPMSPGTLADTPRGLLPVDQVFSDENGTVYMLSRSYRVIFRWSPETRSFLPPLVLIRTPRDAAYSPQLRRIVVNYDDGATQIDLRAGVPSEEPFVTRPPLQDNPLAIDGFWMFVRRASDNVGSRYEIYNAEQQRIAVNLSSNANWGTLWTWNQPTRRLYSFSQFGDTALTSSEVHTDGTFEPATGSTLTTNLRRPPLFASPDGQTLLLGSGALINGSTLQAVDALPHAIDAAVWLGGQLYTANNRVADIEIVRWSAAEHTLEKSLRLPGRLLHLTTYGDDRLVLVGLRDGYLFFAMIDAALTMQSIDENRPSVRLSNLSARAHVGTSDSILIPGFIIGGSGKKKLLIRAAGPGLTQFNVTGALADPQMSIHDSTGATIATNDQWGDNANLADLSTVSTAVNAFPFPSGSKDASLLVSLNPGSYTVHAQGAAEGTGISLVELYDADDIDGSARLVNISARAQVGLGDKVLIPGIIIHGDAPSRVLIRAVGPSLSRYHVEGYLADPQLLILDRNGKAIAVNDDWGASGDPSALAATFETVEAFPLDEDSKDAAVVVTLPPGSYTAHIKGANDTSGVALVEVYYLSR